MFHSPMAQRLTRYGRSLSSVGRHFSNFPPPVSKLVIFQTNEIDPSKKTVPPELSYELFTLPGCATTIDHYEAMTTPTVNPHSWAHASDVLTSASRDNVQNAQITEFCQKNPEKGKDLKELVEEKNSKYLNLECTVHKVPDILKNDFANLFPTMNLKTANLTAITLTQKTVNDMSAWSLDMESERDKLTEDFVKVAAQICGSLKSSNFWADFVDPSSGRPYLGPFTNATLFETDERYKYFGYIVEDMGCCKVIRHIKWGTKAFIGTIFTTAKIDSADIQDLLSLINDSNSIPRNTDS